MSGRTFLIVGGVAVLAVVAVSRSRPGAVSDRLAPFDVVGVAATGATEGRLRSQDLAGRVMLVNVWASWCAPCQEELPKLDSLSGAFDTAQVVFVALSDDVDGAAARQFLNAFRFENLRFGLGLGRLKSDYRYPGLPYTMLIDRDGRVARTWYGYGGPPQLMAIDSTIRSRLESAP